MKSIRKFAIAINFMWKFFRHFSDRQKYKTQYKVKTGNVRYYREHFVRDPL